MAGKAFSPGDLKDTIAQCKKRDLAFGLCLGKKPENTVLVTHKTKSPKVLGQQAKADGETGHFTFGMMAVSGKDLSLTLEGKVPTGIHRKLKELLKKAGLAMKVHIVDPDGGALADDDPEDEQEADTKKPKPEQTPLDVDDAPDDAATDEQAKEAPEPDPLAEKWATTVDEINSLLERLRARAGMDLSKAEDSWTELLSVGESGAFEAALSGVNKLNDILKNLTEAQSTDEQPALASKWEDARKDMQPHIDEVVSKNAPNVKKIQAVWSLAQSKASASTPDYRSALKAVGLVANLVRDAQASLENAAPTAGVSSATPKPDAASTTASGGETTSHTTSGGETASQDTATTGTADTTTTSQTLETEAQPEPAAESDLAADPIAAQVADVVPDLSGAIEDKIDRLLAKITALRTGSIPAYVDLIADAKTAAPAAWTSELDRLQASAEGMKTDPTTVDQTVIDAGLVAVAKLETEIKQKHALKEAVKKALEVFDLRMVPIAAHPQASARDVANSIKPLTSGRADAVAACKTGDHRAALTKLKELGPVADTVENLADDFAHFDAIHLDRKAMVDTYTGKPTTAAQIDDLQAEIEAHYAAALTAKGAKNFAKAVTDLNEIPKKFTTIERLRLRKTEYDEIITNQGPRLVAINAKDAAARAPLQPMIDKCNVAWADGDIAKTGDYAVSIHKLGSLPWMTQDILARINQAQIYADTLVDFDAQLKLLRDHPGSTGIADAIAAMENDRAMAEAEASGNRPVIATSLLDRSWWQWPEFTQRATDCQTYKTKRVGVQVKIDSVKGQAGAATYVTQAETFLASAANAALNGDFVTALKAVADAEVRADAAKTAADTKAEFTKLSKSEELDGVDKDFDAAKKVYTEMRTKLAALDKDNAFTGEIAKADAHVTTAETAATTGLFDEAKAQLTSAIDKLRQTQEYVLARDLFVPHLASTNAEIQRLETESVAKDDCLKLLLDDATAHVTTAELLVEAPSFGFGDGEAALMAADDSCAAAADGIVQYDKIKLDIEKAENSLVNLATARPKVLNQLSHYQVDVQALIDGALADLANGDFDAAATKAERAAAFETAIAEDMGFVDSAFRQENLWYTQKRSNVEGAGKEAGSTELARADAMHENFLKLIAAHNYKAAVPLTNAIGLAIDAAQELIDAEAILRPQLADAKTALFAVVAAKNAHVETQVNALHDLYNTGVERSTEKNYALASKIMLEVKPKADALLLIAQASVNYEPMRKAAEDALIAAEAHDHADAIAAILTRLRGKYDNAIGYADANDFALAEKMLTEIKAAADEAVSTANRHSMLETVNDTIGGDADSEPWQMQIEAARLSLNTVESNDAQGVAGHLITLARDQLKVAETSEGSASKTALLAALEACNEADAVIAQVAFLTQSITDARGLIADLKTHAHAGTVAQDIADMEAKLAKAEVTVLTGQNLDVASADIEAVMTAYHLLKAFPAFYQKFVDERVKDEYDKRLSELEAHAHRYAIKEEIDEMRATLASADAQAENRELEAAIASLKHALFVGSSAKVLADMYADTPPKEADIKAILAQSGGVDQLDDIIDQLEPDAQRAVVKVAFKARFGCDIENFNSSDFANPNSPVPDANLKGPNIVAFYKAMDDLPLDHTMENDKMAKFNVLDVDEGRTSWYDGDEQLIVMDVGDASKTRPEQLANPQEIGLPEDVADPAERAALVDYAPANDEPVTNFSWTTLHEVGHAVDDNQRYMARNCTSADHGGWIEHGADIAGVAEIIAKHHKYDKSYVISYMSGKSGILVPEIPSNENCIPEEWEARRIAVCAHVDLCKEPSAPWYSMSTSRKITIGGRVYQEAYENSWVSYPLAARSKGISGYQFRAPAEWFAELYAAYHSDKLKPSHPSVSWLSEL